MTRSHLCVMTWRRPKEWRTLSNSWSWFLEHLFNASEDCPKLHIASHYHLGGIKSNYWMRCINALTNKDGVALNGHLEQNWGNALSSKWRRIDALFWSAFINSQSEASFYGHHTERKPQWKNLLNLFMTLWRLRKPSSLTNRENNETSPCCALSYTQGHEFAPHFWSLWDTL